METLFAQLVVLESSLALVFGLLLLWRRGVPAYVNAFTWQSIALAGVAATVRRFASEREVAPYVNTATSLVVAGLLVLFAYAIMRPVVAASQLPTRVGMPLAMGLVLVSLFVVVSRKKALTQVIGFLMLENGIALLAILGTYGIPLIVELGVFLDALLGYLVMQIFVYRIQETFQTMG